LAGETSSAELLRRPERPTRVSVRAGITGDAVTGGKGEEGSACYQRNQGEDKYRRRCRSNRYRQRGLWTLRGARVSDGGGTLIGLLCLLSPKKRRGRRRGGATHLLGEGDYQQSAVSTWPLLSSCQRKWHCG
jgi:hypothetical protein